jgi:glutathione-regulated potassium-efflux system protein KefB
MALTPLSPVLLRKLLPPEGQSFEDVEAADGLSGSALVIGFGRFGQVASPGLLARGIDVSIIDSDTEMIRSAARFGFKIYYGDGARLDVLRAAGARTAKIIAVCIDDREAANKIVEIVKTECPLATVLVRSYDRAHSLRLIAAGVDYEIRELLESALAFGEAALIALGVPEEEATETIAAVRRRDRERFEMQMAEGIYAGSDLLARTEPTPTPLTPPKRVAQPLSAETAVVAEAEQRKPIETATDS